MATLMVWRRWRTRRTSTAGDDAALHESEQQLLTIMANAPVGVAVLDDAGRFLAANARLCDMLGRSEEELQGLTTLDVTHPDDIAADLDFGARIRVAGTSPQTLEKRFLRSDGAIVWGQVSATMLRGTVADRTG
ncbi:MAG: PAS domain S-box protein [Nitriliruptoraceae bacterium]